MRWNIFVSNQDKSRAEYYKFFGTKYECILYVTHILINNGCDEELPIGLNINDDYIDYYGLSNIGANLIVTAFKEE